MLIIGRLARFKKLYVIRHYASQHVISGQLKGLIFDKMVNTLATKLIAVSVAVRDRLIEEKVNLRKIEVINNSIRLDEFTNLRNLRRARKKKSFCPRIITVGMIGRTSYVKGYSRLPWILSMLDFKLRTQSKDMQVIFEIVGATGDLQYFDNEISNMTLKKVSVRRIDNHQDISQKLVEWDIFLHIPIEDKAEGFGLVYIEALASGIPSIFLKSGILNEFTPTATSISILDCKQWLQIPDKILYFSNTEVNEVDIKELEQFRMSRLMEQYTQVFDANQN
jgi:glycosyltransferase involved in cell wall biosynthesis